MLAVAALVTAFGCGANDPREAVVVNTLVRADLPLLRTRPTLMAGKYQRMAHDPYSFFRGTFALFQRDARDGALALSRSELVVDAPLPLGMGDAHPENFGTLVASDGSLALEPNDFDTADHYPALVEVRRLCVGMVLAARFSNEGDEPARAAAVAAEGAIARAAAAGYLERLVALDSGAAPERITEGTSPIVDDLFERAAEDQLSREELDELTTLDAGVRRLRRGGIDPDDPNNVFVDLPELVFAPLAEALDDYRASLLAPPPPEELVLLDAVRELGSGVGSWPRLRIIALVRGASDDPADDLLLEVKELADSGAPGYLPPGVAFDDVAARVLGSARRSWARPDAEPRWGTTRLLGFEVQVKLESEAHKTLRLARFVEAEGTPAALEALARTLGELLARMHARDDATRAAFVPLDTGAFADEQAAIAVGYADQVLGDHLRFVDALDDLGPTLGVESAPENALSPEIGAVLAEPGPAVP
jgi:uncharacterized protein (DUF2252 family)